MCLLGCSSRPSDTSVSAALPTTNAPSASATDGLEPTPTSASTTTAAVATLPVGDQWELLAAGEYRAGSFSPGFTFRVGEGWNALATEDVVALSRDNGFATSVRIARWPGFVVTDACLDRVERIETRAAALADWLGSRADMTITEGDLDLGGVRGIQIGLRTESLAACPGSREGVLPLWTDRPQIGDGYVLILHADDAASALLVDVGEVVVAVSVETDATSAFDAFAVEAQQVLQSIRFDVARSAE